MPWAGWKSLCEGLGKDNDKLRTHRDRFRTLFPEP